MDRSLYIAMSGAKQTMLAQTSNANNLANTQTTGFKSDFEQFRSMPVFGPGQPTRVYAMTEKPGTDFTPGPIQTTGRDLDVAINGEGWIAVQGADGQETYTRAGDLRVTPEGFLQTGTGEAVLGEEGPIVIPDADKIDIGSDGTITIIPLGEDATTLLNVDRIRLVKPDLKDLEKQNDGLLHLKAGAEPPVVDASISLLQGAVEGSNVGAVAAMVEMIELSKNYELQVKVMKAADEKSGAATKLMQMS
ncbi:MAG: flagellar basal-body rod protein FlgF [Methyloprofundus sp.]|nr:MAG: flagellar basal-body rod protein FlgF [Methyloprofundus sp.]